MKPKLHWLPEIIAALLILLFVYTAISKLSHNTSFRAVIGKSVLISRFNKFLSYSIPLIELAISILLFFPRSGDMGLMLSVILLGIFTLYIGYMLSLGGNLPCSYSCVLKELSWKQHLVFNIGWLALAFGGWRVEIMNKLFIAINRSSRTPV